MRVQRFSGMLGFTVVWFGQLVSLLGTGMTTFGISVWAYQETGQATALALAAFFGFGPMVLLSPFAGAIVDRTDRRLVMILSDLAAGLATIALFLLYQSDMLEIWHIYVANAFAGAFGAFQFPAYSAAVTTMIRKEQYGRAFGMLSLADSASGIFAPIAAATLIGLIGIGGIMLFDIVTFVVAILCILVVSIPRPKQSAEGAAARGSLLKEAGFGFRYIWERPGLLGLQLTFFMINLIATFSFTLLTPMILARTANNELMLGSVMSLGSIGGVLGGITLTAWGGPKRRVNGVLMGMTLISIAQGFLGVAQGLPGWAAANFAVAFTLPILNGSNQAIWQSKVPPDLQGRVFSVRRMIAQITAPAAMLMAGPLADLFFEPGMTSDGWMTPWLSWLVGSGPGAGIAVMFVISGMLGVLVGLGGYLFPHIREVEQRLPDHDTEPEGSPQPVADPVVSAEIHPSDHQAELARLLEENQRWKAAPPSQERQLALQRIAQDLRRLGQKGTNP